MEEEPVFGLSLGDGREIEATRDNSALFRFLGKLSVYDHAFFVTNEDEGMGVFLFSTSDMFEEVAEYMMLNDYPAHLNLNAVAQCDIDAFDNMISADVKSDLDSGIPTDWE